MLYTHDKPRGDAVEIGHGVSRRAYVPTTEETKWVGNWAEFKDAEGSACWNEDQTEITLSLPPGFKFSIQFNRQGA